MSATKLWYPHHIEKYRRKTAHLTIAEHGAYRLLMDAYWDRRAPLPADETRLRKIIGADKEEWDQVKDAVMAFFTLTDEGWRHEKIDEQIAEAEEKYAAKLKRIEEARAAKAAKDKSDNKTDYSPDDNANGQLTYTNTNTVSKRYPKRAQARGLSGNGKRENVSREKKITPIPPADPKARQVFDFVLGRWGPEIVASWFCSADGRSLIRMNCTAVVIEPHGKVAHERIRNQYWPAIAQEFGENVRLEKFTANAVREG